MALSDASVSSYVVEWFAVREKNSSALHWEKLNRYQTSLVITGNPVKYSSAFKTVAPSILISTYQDDDL